MKPDTRSLNFFILLAGVILCGCAGKPPSDIGLREGRLAPCPGTPNCVISQDGDEQHHIDPIAYAGQRTTAMEMIQQVVQGMPGTRIVTQTDQYLHVEFRSRIMGFVDDVEFFFPDTAVIHVRSASRVGYSDFGVNRKRVEKIRQLFHARLSQEGGT
ncbi:MAG: DUF1499 domain-containing protein [Deltaproteobacteria bacterium]|nr:DUF1499 domain-containing protein [Deltaproteobacteria bacterium]